MLYYLTQEVFKDVHYFHIFKYITFRGFGAAITSMLIMFLFMNKFIAYLQKIQNGGQPIRDDGPESHFKKRGTPTMGGLLMMISIFVSVILWGDLSNSSLQLTMFVTGSYALLGFIDDYRKVTKRNSKGVSGKFKLAYQFIISLVAYLWIQKIMPSALDNKLALPIFKEVLIDLGWLYFPFIACVTIGASNAVNLTDGLDGLAIVPVMITAFCFSVIAYVVGNSIFSEYLKVHHVIGVGELSLFLACMIGAGLGFLWYNCSPAKIFMGDTGSLAFGGSLGIVSVLTKHELVLAMVGGLFVIEALSVIVQVYYYKLSKGKRIFLMAPIHHHFEKKGWSEPMVVVRFWIISIIFAIIGMSTLKIR
ncbi:MAG: phospho-N-acetylmuramoyl-pentapeptide-transferase [Alphaproteobacteria bacterium]|mgnify:FL=1|nr:phospho-N-acetylmuramoyl-pentapeptide-transferase [Alphaproteobacteria bacterium]OJV15074.1 MAG: phospho-N-acetylmuramoyl-pentapeptide-transferase [Alphaproteobacteria bacterium 33-17]